MSNDLAGSEKIKSPSVRVRSDLLEAFDEWCDRNDTNRSAALREYMERCVSGTGLDDADEFLPADKRDRELYLAALDVADGHTINLRREIARLAEETKVAKGKILGRFRDLERRGFTARIATWPGTVKSDPCYRIKPRCAKPDLWKYSKINPAGEAQNG